MVISHGSVHRLFEEDGLEYTYMFCGKYNLEYDVQKNKHDKLCLE